MIDEDAYIPIVVMTLMLDRHTDVQEDIIACLVCQNLEEHLPAVQVCVFFEKVIETTGSTDLP
jgi:hypothetical protein